MNANETFVDVIERVIIDAPSAKASETILIYAHAIAKGLAAAARMRPLTLVELDLCADACCQDIANGGDTSIDALQEDLRVAVATLSVPIAQNVFRRCFMPCALNVVPIVGPENSIAHMNPEGTA